MTAALLTVNASAGSADRQQLDTAVAILREQWSVEIVILDSEGDLVRALDLLDGRPLVVAGGDGTLHRTVAALHGRNQLSSTVLALLPLGTGNDFARQVGLPLDVADAARTLLGAEERAVDLIVDDTGGIAVNNVHFGVGAEASRRGAAWKERFGRVGYGLGLVRAAFAPAFRIDVSIDGAPVVDRTRPVLEVSLGNGSTIGGGLRQHPGAQATDGRIDVIISFATNPLRRLSYGIDLLRARHDERADVLRRLCNRVEVSGDPFHVSADGEIYGLVTNRTWQVEAGALRMLLPRWAR